MERIVLQITRTFKAKQNRRTSYLWYTCKTMDGSDLCRIHFHGDYCKSADWENIPESNLFEVITIHLNECLKDVAQ